MLLTVVSFPAYSHAHLITLAIVVFIMAALAHYLLDDAV
jgi:hypothetical protein